MSCPHRQATTVHRLRQAPMRSRSPDQCVRVGARARSTQRSQGAEAPVRISSQTESRAPTPHPGRPSPSSRCAADSSSLSDLRPRPLLAVESRGAFPYGFHRATKPAAALGGPAPPRAGFYPGWSWVYRSWFLGHFARGNHAAAPVLGESAWRTAAGVRWPWRSTRHFWL